MRLKLIEQRGLSEDKAALQKGLGSTEKHACGQGQGLAA